MRSLFPTRADSVDLDAAYWVEDFEGQFVSAVMIGSLDGAARLDGASGGLGNAADAALFALLRAQCDVILVGAATARIEGYGGDRPDAAMRAVRRRHGLTPAPRIAVVTNRAELAPTGPLLCDTEVPPLIITTAAAPAANLEALVGGAEIVVAGDATVDLGTALDELRDRGLLRVSCEGGPTLLGQLIAAERLDELRLTVSPRLLVGDSGRITAGPLVVNPRTLELVHILEDEGFLFLRYRSGRA